MKSVPLPGEVIRRLPSRRITDDEFSFHRETDVILRESLGCGSRTGHVIQFGKLAAMVEGILIWKAMQHGSHPPREPLHFPDPPQAHFGIAVEQVATSTVIKMLESPCQYLNIGNREIQSLGSSWRDDMRRVSS
jgi:hypothetical protein